MIWPLLLAPTVADQPTPSSPSSTEDLGESVVPELNDMFGVRPMSGAFIQIARKWALPLCVDDALLHPMWKADVKSLSHGDSKDVMHGLPLDGVRMTSARDVAEQVVALDRVYRPLLRYELTMVGDCVTAKVVSRLGPHGWEPVESVLDRRLQMPPTSTFQQGRGALETALTSAGVKIEPHSEALTEDRTCVMPGTVRTVRDVLSDLLACAPVEGVPSFFLRTDGELWVVAISVADPTTWSVPQPVVVHEGGGYSPRVRDRSGRKTDLGQSMAPPLAEASVTDTRPVSQAFSEVAHAWGLRLCHEDGPLDPRWWPEGTPGPGRRAPPETVRTIELSDLPFTTTQGVAEEILRRAEAGHPIQHYALRDIGGCLTASVVERVAPDGVTWERVTPPLDTLIAVPQTTTYLTALDAFDKGMKDAGFTFDTANNDMQRHDRSCVVQGGGRVAWEILADVLSCSPFADRAAWSLLTSLDGQRWMLNLRVAGDVQSFPSEGDDFE